MLKQIYLDEYRAQRFFDRIQIYTCNSLRKTTAERRPVVSSILAYWQAIYIVYH